MDLVDSGKADVVEEKWKILLSATLKDKSLSENPWHNDLFSLQPLCLKKTTKPSDAFYISSLKKKNNFEWA